MKTLALLCLILTCATGCQSQVNEWHPLVRLTPSQAHSMSYRFLVSKFGADHLLTECDPEEAAQLGDSYLFQVMGDGNDERDGETIGHGATLQEALDSAAASYIPPAEVIALRKQMEQQNREIQKRTAEYRKKCCATKESQTGGGK